jgi:hypothetical protein
MMQDLTVETFEPHLGDEFRVRVLDSGDVHAFVLAEAATPPSKVRVPEGRRTPFHLIFRGPEGLVLPQGIYEFEHAMAGRYQLFMVPVADPEGGGGCVYQVIFA